MLLGCGMFWETEKKKNLSPLSTVSVVTFCTHLSGICSTIELSFLLHHCIMPVLDSAVYNIKILRPYNIKIQRPCAGSRVVRN